MNRDNRAIIFSTACFGVAIGFILSTFMRVSGIELGVEGWIINLGLLLSGTFFCVLAWLFLIKHENRTNS